MVLLMVAPLVGARGLKQYIRESEKDRGRVAPLVGARGLKHQDFPGEVHTPPSRPSWGRVD